MPDTPPHDDYLGFGAALIQAHPGHRTLSGLLDGRRVWVKKVAPAEARVWHHLQRMVALCLRKPILRETVSPGGPRALAQEAERLKTFQAQGFHVPDVLAMDDHMMILSDLGPQLQEYLHRLPDANDRVGPLRAAARALGKLHQAGLCHGRPYIRDMTWDGSRIGFLDLEENPGGVMPLPAAQARDIWIFLSSAARFARAGDSKYSFTPDLIIALLDEYRPCASPETLMALHDFVHGLAGLGQWLQIPFFWARIGNDARQAVFISGILENTLPLMTSKS